MCIILYFNTIDSDDGIANGIDKYLRDKALTDNAPTGNTIAIFDTSVLGNLGLNTSKNMLGYNFFNFIMMRQLECAHACDGIQLAHSLKN